MKTKKLNVKYDIGDVVWLLFDKKARQGVVYSVGIDYQSFASFCEKNIKDLRHYPIETKTEVTYHIGIIENDVCTNAIASMSGDEIFSSKKELLASL